MQLFRGCAASGPVVGNATSAGTLDVMPDAGSARLCVLSVHAHPDDEASKGAATIARYHAEGVHTVLVTCTGGEAGEILNPDADTPEAQADLGAVRMRELEDAVRIIGYDSLHLLGYRDSGMPDTEPQRPPRELRQRRSRRSRRPARADRAGRATAGDDHLQRRAGWLLAP